MARQSHRTEAALHEFDRHLATELDREVGGTLDIPKLVEVARRHEVKIPPPPGTP